MATENSLSNLPGEGGGVGRLCTSVTTESGDDGLRSGYPLLLGGRERGEDAGREICIPEPDAMEDIDVFDPGERVNVEGAGEVLDDATSGGGVVVSV